MTALARGTRIAGRYVITGVVGEGGFGAVYEATDEALARTVAVKVLARRDDGSTPLVARFEREARATASLPNEHVAAVHDVGTHEGAYFLVMERLVGHDLSGEPRPVSVSRAVDLALAAALALAHAHARGIVHRDLKPGNLFVVEREDGTDTVKLLDFGIAKVLASTEALTASDTLLGTPRYMAPEQIRSPLDVDARTDVWGLGVVLYELLTGGPPFDKTRRPELVASILLEPPPPIAARRADVPQALAVVLSRCLEKEPERRFPDVASLAEALEPFGGPVSRGIGARARAVLARPPAPDALAETAVAETVEAPLVHPGVRRALEAPTASIERSRETPSPAPRSPETRSTASLASRVSEPGRRERPRREGSDRLAESTEAIASAPRAEVSRRRGPRRGATFAVAVVGTIAAAAVGAGAHAFLSAQRDGAPPREEVPDASAPPRSAVAPSTEAPVAPSASVSALSPPPHASIDPRRTPPRVDHASPSSSVVPAVSSTAAPAPSASTVTARTVTDDLRDACAETDSVERLRFLAPQASGPRYAFCSEIAFVGCARVRAGCASPNRTSEERDACASFLGALRIRRACQ